MQWSSETARSALSSWLTRTETVAWLAVCNAELLIVLWYLLITPGTARSPWLYVMPFVWINVSIWAVIHATVPTGVARSKRLLGGVLAIGYFLVLGYVGGLVGSGLGPLATGLRLELVSLPPGFSPALLYAGEQLRIALLPFKLVGYLTLAWLVYLTAIDVAGSLTASVLGLFSCVSCVLPVIAAVLGSVLGGTGALVTVASAQSYLLSTVAFVLTVGLLVYQPTAGSFSRWRS